MHVITVKTQRRTQFVSLDVEIQKFVDKSGVTSGVCRVFIPHTTAGVTINENADPDVVSDIIDALERMVPWENNYAHTEGNSAAHIKSSMMGCEKNVLIENGRLALGTWQSIYFCEFDGPRNRQAWVSVIPV